MWIFYSTAIILLDKTVTIGKQGYKKVDGPQLENSFTSTGSCSDHQKENTKKEIEIHKLTNMYFTTHTDKISL